MIAVMPVTRTSDKTRAFLIDDLARRSGVARMIAQREIRVRRCLTHNVSVPARLTHGAHAQSYGLRFPRAPFQFSKCAAGEPAKFSRRGVEFLGMIGAARLECAKPATETGELIRRQLGNSFGDFFDLHVAQYSTAGTRVAA